MKYKTLIKLIPALLLAACVTTTQPILRDPNAPNAEQRGILSVKMVNLSSAVDTYFADLPVAPTESDAIILQKSTQHDPRLLAPEFDHYVLKVQYQNPYAVLLLCSKDGKSAIMEDAGCSARIDRQETHVAPCEFTLRVSQGCHVEGADPQ
jgi:hypothetical protein